METRRKNMPGDERRDLTVRTVVDLCAQQDPATVTTASIAERMGLTARGYHRVIRVARTLADLEDAQGVTRLHIAEALSYREPVGARLGTAA